MLHSEKIETTKTITTPERVVKDDFVCSVAKGEKYKLTKEYQGKITSSVSGEVFDLAKLNLTAEITAKYSEEHLFEGPSSSSKYNSREFRVKFYREDGKYIQERYVYYWPSGELYGIQSHGGTYKNPTKYAKYSVDKKI